MDGGGFASRLDETRVSDQYPSFCISESAISSGTFSGASPKMVFYDSEKPILPLELLSIRCGFVRIVDQTPQNATE